GPLLEEPHHPVVVVGMDRQDVLAHLSPKRSSRHFWWYQPRSYMSTDLSTSRKQNEHRLPPPVKRPLARLAASRRSFQRETGPRRRRYPSAPPGMIIIR